MQEEYLTTKEVTEIFKVHTQTILRWRNTGKIKYQQISPKKFLYRKSDIEKMLGITINETRVNVMYCRTNKNKEDLIKQQEIINNYCNANGIIIDKIFTEIASGMNEDRKEFNKLIEMVINKQINKIYITYKDRLTRFGFNYFENLFKMFGTEIVVLNNINQEDFEKELTEDLKLIINNFSKQMSNAKQLKEIQKQLNN